MHYEYSSSSHHTVAIMKWPPFSRWGSCCCVEHKRDLITSALFPLSHWNLEGKLLIATSNSSSVHQTFLIKFQVNWLRSNLPEAEWQSGSKDNTQLFVREPQQQEKGNVITLLFSLNLMIVLIVWVAFVFPSLLVWHTMCKVNYRQTCWCLTHCSLFVVVLSPAVTFSNSSSQRCIEQWFI